MKQFLLDQFNNFNQATVDKFQADMIGPLPTFSKPKVWESTIWGYEPEGFWYTNKDQTYFFENNGTVHTLGITFNPFYYKMYEILYQENKKNVMSPLEISVETVLPENHFRGFQPSGEVYYMKFETPNQGYGKNITVFFGDYNSESYELYLQQYIDQLIEVFFTFRKLNIAFVPTCNLFNFFVTPTNNFFMFFENFTPVDYTSDYRIDSMIVLLDHINDILNKNNFTGKDINRFLDSTRNKFYSQIVDETLTKLMYKLADIINTDLAAVSPELQRLGKILPINQLLEEIRNNMLKEIKEKCLVLVN